MAILFVDNFSENKNRMLHSAVRVLEILLLAGAITTLLIVKGAMIPYSCELVFSCLVGFWNSIKCLLSSPLYICTIINFMIVLIAFSSNFYHHENNNHDDGITVNLDEHEVQTFKSQPSSPTPPPQEFTAQPPLRSTEITSTKILYTNRDDSPKISQNYEEKPNLSSPKPLLPNWGFIQESIDFKKTTNSLNPTSESMKTKMETKNPPLTEAEVTDDRSDHRENEEEDTMEATWKLITDGGNQKPKKKELKKSETWVLPPITNNVEVQRLDSDEVVVPSVKWKEVRKSETFNDTVSLRRNGGLRRDPSVSIDEFNNQVEAYIKKFNADMRLPRQESYRRFLEMINQGL